MRTHSWRYRPRHPTQSQTPDLLAPICTPRFYTTCTTYLKPRRRQRLGFLHPTRCSLAPPPHERRATTTQPRTQHSTMDHGCTTPHPTTAHGNAEQATSHQRIPFRQTGSTTSTHHAAPQTSDNCHLSTPQAPSTPHPLSSTTTALPTSIRTLPTTTLANVHISANYANSQRSTARRYHAQMTSTPVVLHHIAHVLRT